MQALLLNKPLLPFRIKIKSNFLFIYYGCLLLLRLNQGYSHSLCTFILHALIAKNPVIGKVARTQTPTRAWVGFKLTSGLAKLKLELFQIRFSLDWTIEPIPDGKCLRADQDPSVIVTLKHQSVELLSPKNCKQIFDLNNQEQRSLVLDLLAIDHPVFSEFVQLIKAE